MKGYSNVRCEICGHAMCHAPLTTWPPTSIECVNRLCANVGKTFEPVTVELARVRIPE